MKTRIKVCCQDVKKTCLFWIKKPFFWASVRIADFLYSWWSFLLNAFSKSTEIRLVQAPLSSSPERTSSHDWTQKVIRAASLLAPILGGTEVCFFFRSLQNCRFQGLRKERPAWQILTFCQSLRGRLLRYYDYGLSSSNLFNTEAPNIPTFQGFRNSNML